MAYSEHVIEARRCTATRSNGEPCRAFAAWGDELGRCGGHGGRSTGRPTCTCLAYNWPHRPGGGLCRWPDEPLYRLTTPAGMHGPHRNARRSFPGLYRIMRRYGMR